MTFAAGNDLVQEFAFNPHLGRFTRSIKEVFMSKKSQKRRSEMLPVLHPDAAGVDIGAEELFVAVPSDRDSQPVRRFFDLHAGFARAVGVAEAMWYPCGCDGVDQRLLDSALPNS